MRDDRHKWNAPIQFDGPIDLGAATLEPVTLQRQSLLSGPDVLGKMDRPIVHWPDIAVADSYALCLRRDRVLIVNGPEYVEGWDVEEQRAITDASDAYAVFDLFGDGALEVLKRGAELSLDAPSKSVARRVFGLDLQLYRVASQDRYRLHVASAYKDALTDKIQASAALQVA